MDGTDKVQGKRRVQEITTCVINGHGRGRLLDGKGIHGWIITHGAQDKTHVNPQSF